MRDAVEVLRLPGATQTGMRARHSVPASAGYSMSAPSGSGQALLVDALRRLLAAPAGLPLYAVKSRPGLFAASAAARQAAELAQEEGYIRLVSEGAGRAAREICLITDKGLAHLLQHANPQDLLESLVRSVDARQGQIDGLLHRVQEVQSTLHGIKTAAEKALRQSHGRTSGVPPLPYDKTTADRANWLTALLGRLSGWQEQRNLEDCPLPELYRSGRETAPALTIGQFHDGLRQLHESGQISLHPWTGPLYEIPEPALAMLAGHEIVYYASFRTSNDKMTG